MSIRFRTVCAAAAVAPLALLAACGSSGSTASSSGSASASATASTAGNGSVTLSETGSTLMFPLFGAWQSAYNTAVPAVTITSGGTGSGTGIADAATGTVTIGASDAYLAPADASKGLINIPLAVAAVMVNYNVPGIKKPLDLNGTVLAKIYSGKITSWNDKAIAALNPGVTLPSLKIVTLHRADSSGSTFLFTSYLNAQDPTDWASSNVDTTVTWPKTPGSLAETGSGGMVSGCGSTKGCIAYIGISYLAKTQAVNLGAASLANKAGKFTQPTNGTIKAALASFSSSTPASGSQALINTSAAGGYPIINYEYAIVKKAQSSAPTTAALKAFLKWTITTGSSVTFLGAVGFVALPSNVQTIAENEISSISG